MKEYEKIACGALEANFSVENTFVILFTVDFYKFAAKRRKKSTSKNPQFWPPNAAEKNPQFCQTLKKTLVTLISVILSHKKKNRQFLSVLFKDWFRNKRKNRQFRSLDQKNRLRRARDKCFNQNKTLWDSNLTD